MRPARPRGATLCTVNTAEGWRWREQVGEGDEQGGWAGGGKRQSGETMHVIRARGGARRAKEGKDSLRQRSITRLHPQEELSYRTVSVREGGWGRSHARSHRAVRQARLCLHAACTAPAMGSCRSASWNRLLPPPWPWPDGTSWPRGEVMGVVEAPQNA